MAPRVPSELARFAGRFLTAFTVDRAARTSVVRGRCIGPMMRPYNTPDAVPHLAIEPSWSTRRHYVPRYIPLIATTLIFDGDSELKTDGEALLELRPTPRRFLLPANGLLNLCGPEVARMRALVGQANQNPAFTALDLVIAVAFPADAAGTIGRRVEIPVFPEVPTLHAVVRRIREDAQGGPS